MIYDYYVSCYKFFLLMGSIGTTKVIVGSMAEPKDYLLELGVGVGAAILILREVFNFLRTQSEDNKSKEIREIRDMVSDIKRRLDEN